EQQEEEDIFRVIQKYGNKVGADIELTLAIPDLEVEQCEAETRDKTWAVHVLQRLEQNVKELKGEREALERRIGILESTNPFVKLMHALQSFGATDLTPAAL